MTPSTSTSENHSDPSRNWLIFFLVCFGIIMAIGLWAVFCYKCNAPGTAPGRSEHSGMILPDGSQTNSLFTVT